MNNSRNYHAHGGNEWVVGGKLTFLPGATVEGAEKVVFNNYYNPSPAFITLKGTKVLEGRELTEAEFSFELKTKNGRLIETAQNSADGSFSFSAIEYDSTGIYYYTVNEVIGNDKDVLYDATVYDVKVIVTDNGNGKLVAKVESDGIVFTNSVITPPEETTEAPEEAEEKKPAKKTAAKKAAASEDTAEEKPAKKTTAKKTTKKKADEEKKEDAE